MAKNKLITTVGLAAKLANARKLVGNVAKTKSKVDTGPSKRSKATPTVQGETALVVPQNNPNLFECVKDEVEILKNPPTNKSTISSTQYKPIQKEPHSQRAKVIAIPTLSPSSLLDHVNWDILGKC